MLKLYEMKYTHSNWQSGPYEHELFIALDDDDAWEVAIEKANAKSHMFRTYHPRIQEIKFEGYYLHIIPV